MANLGVLGIQTSIITYDGNPEGNVKAPYGTLAIDGVTAALYMKRTVGTLNTGWVSLSFGSISSNPIQSGAGDPNGSVVGSKYDLYIQVHADSTTDLWVKTIEGGNLGWV